MNKVSSVLIIGANFTNKGAEAMLKVVQQQLRRKYADPTCYMICRKYERELAVSFGFIPVFSHETRLQKWFNGYAYRAKGKLYKIVTGKNRPWHFPFPFGEIGKIIDGVDMIIDISGFAYADSWGRPMIDETIRLVRLGKQYDVKCFFMPQAWGPFENADVAKSARHMLTLADGFYARDTVSRTHLAKLLGRRAESIPLLPDLVFSAAEETGPSMRSGSKYRVGISPNLRVYEKLAGKGIENQYVRVLLALCNYCLQTLDAEIVLIPNEVFPDQVVHPDDRSLCRLLYNLLGEPSKCLLIDQYASSETISEHIQQVDVLVSSRFHALIFGFSARKPVMAISWSHKYRELFGLFGMEDYVLESDAIDERAVIAKFQQLFDEQDEVAKNISARLPGLKARVDTMFSNLLD